MRAGQACAAGLLLAALMLTCGCQTMKPKPPEKEVNEYALAQSKMLGGDYAGAEAALKEYIQLNPKGAYVSDSWLLLGDSQMKQQNYAEAQKSYEQAQIKPRTKAVNARAKEGLGNAMMAQKRFAEAAQAWEAALALSRTDIHASQTLLYLGKCYIRIGNWALGRDRLRQLTTRYPNSLEAPEARDIWTLPSDTYSVQVGAFSTRAAAETMVDKLQKGGVLGARIVQRSYASAPYAVRVGNFVNYQAAAAESAKLESLAPGNLIFP